MIFHVYSDGLYISAPSSQSRAGRHYFISDKLMHKYKPPITTPINNGSLHIKCRIMLNNIASGAEVEVGTLFHNGQISIPTKVTLKEMGHYQLPIPILIYNSTALRFVEFFIRQKIPIQ